MKVEAWAARLLKGLANSGAELPEDAFDIGIAAVVAMGARGIAKLDWSDAEPLMAEMLACAQIVPDPARPAVARPMIESDIEEVSTLLALRSEIVELHVGFSIAAVLSKLGAVAKASSSLTPMSPNSSGLSPELVSPASTT